MIFVVAKERLSLVIALALIDNIRFPVLWTIPASDIQMGKLVVVEDTRVRCENGSFYDEVILLEESSSFTFFRLLSETKLNDKSLPVCITYGYRCLWFITVDLESLLQMLKN
ncbi:hypothetical protein A3I18_02140 [Candidatus Campbellbacteria bacterium RIFCSPLOWO2_02_FULL_35_11]|uniref:Uncharacterized protein n=1 Tax=Candidatus Campbellbacteria bacterium RIFCSPLOWO2_02_FULL_35_11 TaxID=1797581 RepID=A0A1F5ER53_9BACT|nr:MAG: hypothetical protein A3I18_02140 [Candidatus Campbellbacteria bacterium RIFCSPLOWO2_02_FULL_35_11]